MPCMLTKDALSLCCWCCCNSNTAQLLHSAWAKLYAGQGMGVQLGMLTWLAQAGPNVVLLPGIAFHAVNGGMKDIIVHVC